MTATEPPIRSFGLLRKGPHREGENLDGLLALDDLGLFVVVDAFGASAAADVTLETMERRVRAAEASASANDVLTGAATEAHRRILELRANVGAELACAWIRGGVAHLVWSGNCRVYHARGSRIETLTGPWRNAIPIGTCLGCPEPEVHSRRALLEDGDTLVLTTDGYHHLADGNDHPFRDDPEAYFVRAPLAELASGLMERAELDDDATVLCVRFRSAS